jgi:hypothetical protein
LEKVGEKMRRGEKEEGEKIRNKKQGIRNKE